MISFAPNPNNELGSVINLLSVACNYANNMAIDFEIKIAVMLRIGY